jgi:hypothetical protein
MTTHAPFRRAGLAPFLALALALATSHAAGVSTVRDIYSTHSSEIGFYLARPAEHEGGAQIVSTSTTTIHSAPYSLRLKFLADVARNVAGIRFIASGSTPAATNLQPHRSTAALEFWLNPKTVSSLPSFSVGLVSNSGIKVETRRPLSAYLARSDFGDKWTFVSIPLDQFPDTGETYDPKTGQSTPAPFDWTQVVGLNFSCDTTGTPYYDPSVDDIRIN